MKNRDLFELKRVITAIKESGTNKFKLPLILNEIEIDKHIEILESLRKPSDKYNEYENKRRELAKGHSQLDETGEIMLFSEADGKGQRKYDFGVPNIIYDKDEFLNKSKELQAEYETILEEEVRKEKEFMQTLEENSIFIPKLIPFNDFPEAHYDILKALTPLMDMTA